MKTCLTIFLFLICAGTTFGQDSSESNSSAKSLPSEHERAVEFYTQEDYKSAFPLFVKAVEADKTDWESWLYAAMCLTKTGDSKNAALAFKNAVAVYPFKDRDKTAPDPKNDFKITSKSHAPYTDSARANNISGVVYLAVEFRADRKIGIIVPLKSLPFGLTQNSVDAAKSIKFNPLTINGKPVSTIKIMEYYFTVY